MSGEAASDGTGFVPDLLQQPLEDDKDSLVDQDQQSYLCSRCRKIDFDEIFSRNSVARGGDPILSFNGKRRVLRDPKCAFCQAMQFIYPCLDIRSQSWKQSSLLVAASLDDFNRFQRKGPIHAEGKLVLTFAHHYGYPEHKNIIRRWTRGWVEQRDGRGMEDDYHHTVGYLAEEQTTDSDWVDEDEYRNTEDEYRGIGDEYRDMVGYLAEEQAINSDWQAFPAASLKPHVDLEMIKQTLNECRASHSRCRNKRRGVVPGMRLIDCETRTVIPAPRRCTYAALSYVWGTSMSTSESIVSLCNGYEVLPAEIPSTIADAMLVTLKLKIRYLWCDRYCIRQDPETEEEKNEKHRQIARMCDIYGGASITIIAAAGDGPDYGLPGVVKKRKFPRVRIGSRTLLATLADPKTLIDRSKWSTRGWTFQEGLLARRRLVFTEQQVYFQCGGTSAFEAYDKSGNMSISINPILAEYNPVYPYFSMGMGGVPDIWLSIDNYANLTLGDPQDILNGFLGILKRYEEVAYVGKGRHARNIAGLPMEREIDAPQSWPSKLFAALAWNCNIPGRRRAGFPSWSWIGWYCRGFARNEDEPYLPTGPISFKGIPRSCSVSVEGPNNELLEYGKFHELIEARHDLSKAKFLHVTAPSLEARIIPGDGVSYFDYDMSSFVLECDNNEGKLAVRYLGFKKPSHINLSDKRLLDTTLPSEGLQCFGIILGGDDIPNDRPDEHEVKSFQHEAITLIVVEKDSGFERIGVSCLDSRKVLQKGATIREFKLM